MKIAILNAEAGGNKGAEAMLEILIVNLLKNLDNPVLYLEVGGKLDYYTEVFLKKFADHNIKILRFTPKIIMKPYNIDLSIIDYAIDIGGINFHNNLGYRALVRSYIRYRGFITNKTKLIFFTQDFGPVNNYFTKVIGSHILQKAVQIFPRSEKSYNELISTFNINKDVINGPYPDSTLVFNSNENNERFNLSDNYIVLSPSSIMYSKHGQKYIDYFISLANLYKENYEIVLLVHNFTYNGNAFTDSKVCQQILDSCPYGILIDENVSTSILKEILKKSVFTISSRYHVVVGSISQNVPTLAIGWNPKYLSFLKLYDKENWNLEFSDSIALKSKDIIHDGFLDSVSELDIKNKVLKKEVYKSFINLLEVIKIETN